MRGGGAGVRGLLAVAAVAAVAAAGHAHGALGEDYLSSFCRDVTNDSRINKKHIGRNSGTLSISGKEYDIVFSWDSEAERAAAALLVLAWRCAGYRRVRLADRRARQPGDRYSSDRVSVSLSERYAVGERRPVTREVVGPGVAPLAPRLHVRLAPAARAVPGCTHAFYNASFYLHRDNLLNCSFITSFENTTIYIPREWSTITDRNSTLYEEFPTIMEFLKTHNSSQYTKSWAELEKLVLHDRDESFLFVDADLWQGVEGVFAGIDPPPLSKQISMRFIDANLRRYAPSLWNATRFFSLNTSDIREVLALEMDPLKAAFTWAQQPANRARLVEWIVLSTQPTWNNMDLLLCDDLNNADYDDLIKAISDTMSELTLQINFIGIQLYKYYVNCSDTTSWNKQFTSNKGESKYYGTIGTVMSGEGVYKVAEQAKSFGHSLSAYSMTGSSHVFPLGGTPEAFVESLQQLLHNCSVRRIGVISEKSSVATDVTAALHRLHDKGTLTFRDVPLSDSNEETVTVALNLLDGVKTHFFLINGGTLFAKNIIRVAKNMEFTPKRGYLWIVREWVGPGDETMKPFELTFAYRGGGKLASAELRDLESRLDRRWRNGSWPQHAAPLAAAVLALAVPFARLTVTLPSAITDVHAPKTYRLLLENSSRFPSLVGNIRTEKQVVERPRPFVYRWDDAGPLPALVAGAAAPAPGRCPLLAAPLDDGSITCLTSSDGVAFPPTCNDVLWLCLVIASILIVLIFILIVMTCRRALRARDKRIIEEAEKMGRARLDAFTSSLAPYFVERKALKLRYQIGAGRFGLVWFGILHEPTGGTRPVAAKALREGAVAEEQSEFFREARNLAVLQHDHVVRFVGVCVADGPPLLLMEYAFFGDLLQYLSNRRHLVESSDTDSTEAQYVSADALTRHARDAATALAFIVRRGFVHRDVRATNCLVDDRRMLKLADFGMAREMSGAGNEHDGEYWCRRRSLFPVLWMAPESLSRGVFSTASDVWALGVLALELITLGARPYGGRSPFSVVELVAAGGRPPLPQDIEAGARELLLQCWRRAPAARPSAAAVAAWLEEHPRALRPALTAQSPSATDVAGEEEVDSGIGEPPGPASPLSLRSLSFDDNSIICRRSL